MSSVHERSKKAGAHCVACVTADRFHGMTALLTFLVPPSDSGVRSGTRALTRR